MRSPILSHTVWRTLLTINHLGCLPVVSIWSVIEKGFNGKETLTSQQSVVAPFTFCCVKYSRDCLIYVLADAPGLGLTMGAERISPSTISPLIQFIQVDFQYLQTS
jgi:hypothetical protein